MLCAKESEPITKFHRRGAKDAEDYILHSVEIGGMQNAKPICFVALPLGGAAYFSFAVYLSGK